MNRKNIFATDAKILFLNKNVTLTKSSDVLFFFCLSFTLFSYFSMNFTILKAYRLWYTWKILNAYKGILLNLYFVSFIFNSKQLHYSINLKYEHYFFFHIAFYSLNGLRKRNHLYVFQMICDISLCIKACMLTPCFVQLNGGSRERVRENSAAYHFFNSIQIYCELNTKCDLLFLHSISSEHK